MKASHSCLVLALLSCSLIAQDHPSVVNLRNFAPLTNRDYRRQNRSLDSFGKPEYSGRVNWIESASRDNTFARRRIAGSYGRSEEGCMLPKEAA
jgi:hypothetical protein